MGITRPQVGARPLALVLAVTAVALVGCGGGDGGDGADSSSDAAGASSGAAAGSGAKAVTIQDYTYKPATITVPTGTTVSFTNRDSTPHTATSKEAGEFESGSIDTGKSGEVTLEKTGTFAYYCLFHPFMQGTIIVT